MLPDYIKSYKGTVECTLYTQRRCYFRHNTLIVDVKASRATEHFGIFICGRTSIKHCKGTISSLTTSRNFPLLTFYLTNRFHGTFACIQSRNLRWGAVYHANEMLRSQTSMLMRKLDTKAGQNNPVSQHQRNLRRNRHELVEKRTNLKLCQCTYLFN